MQSLWRRWRRWRRWRPVGCNYLHEPSKAFVILSLIWGLIFFLLIPPFQAPDEVGHFIRTYALASGYIIETEQDNRVGSVLPKSVQQLVNAWGGIPFHPEIPVNPNQWRQSWQIELRADDIELVEAPTSAIYSPVPYLPQILGAKLGIMLGLKPICIFYLGRLSNFIVWILAIHQAILLMPIQPWTMMLVAVTPMALSQAVSLSSDPVVTELGFLSTALILRVALSPQIRQISRLGFGVILGISVLLGFCKPPYFALSLLSLLIALERIPLGWRSSVKALAFRLTPFIVSLGTWLVWSRLNQVATQMFFVWAHQMRQSDPLAQVLFLLHHPLKIFSIAWRELGKIEDIVEQFIGFLGWLDTRLPSFIWFSYAIVLLLVSIWQPSYGASFTYPGKLKILGILIVPIIGIYISQYLAWTSVANEEVLGVQGRYFIPLSGLFFTLFHSPNYQFKISPYRFSLVLLSYVTMVLLVTSVTLLGRYYHIGFGT